MSATASDQLMYSTLWTCEKWSEEAVDFSRKYLEDHGITHVPAELVSADKLPKSRVNKLLSEVLGRPIAEAVYRPRFMPITEGISSAMLRAIVGEPEECTEIVGNLLLNEGLQRLLDLTQIATVTSNQVAGNPWSNANAFTGVGDSSTAEAATQTDLQAATNHFYKAMNATFPSRANQTTSFQSDFTSAEANYAWQEWTISAGATTASGSGFTTGTTNLNRKVSSLGTKSTGTWTLTSQITYS